MQHPALTAFHEACKVVLDHAPAKPAKDYAHSGLSLQGKAAVRLQTAYILSNLAGWRGDQAKATKEILRAIAKFKIPSAKKSDPSTILSNAADLIEEFGWCQHHYTEGSKFCTIGAIAEAVRLSRSTCSHLDCQTLTVLADHLQLDTPYALARWNDAPQRTKEEVIATLRQAANSLSKEK